MKFAKIEGQMRGRKELVHHGGLEMTSAGASDTRLCDRDEHITFGLNVLRSLEDDLSPALVRKIHSEDTVRYGGR